MFRTTGVNVSISMTNSVVSEEDMSVEFCVMVVGLLDKIVNINVDSNNGSAIGKCILIFFSVYTYTVQVLYVYLIQYPNIMSLFRTVILMFVSNTIIAEGMDYKGLHVELHLNGTATTACVNVTILEDEILEVLESFFVVLSTTDPAVNIMERNTEVVIQDNDSELLSQECFKYM